VSLPKPSPAQHGNGDALRPSSKSAGLLGALHRASRSFLPTNQGTTSIPWTDARFRRDLHRPRAERNNLPSEQSRLLFGPSPQVPSRAGPTSSAHSLCRTLMSSCWLRSFAKCCGKLGHTELPLNFPSWQLSWSEPEQTARFACSARQARYIDRRWSATAIQAIP
jgi:hypothetical protein